MPRLIEGGILIYEETHSKLVSVYIDELQDYIASISQDFADSLAQARGLGMGITMAHQYREQLPPEIRAAVDNNARNNRYNRKLAIRAENAANREFHRSGITNESVTYIGAICKTAEAVIQAVPSSRGPIATVIQGCAEAMRNTIMRF